MEVLLNAKNIPTHISRGVCVCVFIWFLMCHNIYRNNGQRLHESYMELNYTHQNSLSHCQNAQICFRCEIHTKTGHHLDATIDT